MSGNLPASMIATLVFGGICGAFFAFGRTILLRYELPFEVRAYAYGSIFLVALLGYADIGFLQFAVVQGTFGFLLVLSMRSVERVFGRTFVCTM